MTVEDSLKALILERFKSVRAFATAIGKPCSSVNNIFSRGVNGAGISTIIPLCRALGIDADALADGKIKPRYTPQAGEALASDEKHLLDYFRDFNEEGKQEALKRLSEMAQLDCYKKRGEGTNPVFIEHHKTHLLIAGKGGSADVEITDPEGLDEEVEKLKRKHNKK